jgi:hypothetical protein
MEQENQFAVPDFQYIFMLEYVVTDRAVIEIGSAVAVQVPQTIDRTSVVRMGLSNDLCVVWRDLGKIQGQVAVQGTADGKGVSDRVFVGDTTVALNDEFTQAVFLSYAS